VTAQMTTQPADTGTRVAPTFVVIVAVLAFAAGLALAQVVAPTAARSTAAAVAVPAAQAATAAVATRSGAVASRVSSAFTAAHRSMPTKADDYSILAGWARDGRIPAEGRHR